MSKNVENYTNIYEGKLSENEMRVLKTFYGNLFHATPLTIHDVSKKLELNRSETKKNMNMLIKKGLMEWWVNTNDRLRLSLTAEGIGTFKYKY